MQFENLEELENAAAPDPLIMACLLLCLDVRIDIEFQSALSLYLPATLSQCSCGSEVSSEYDDSCSCGADVQRICSCRTVRNEREVAILALPGPQVQALPR